MEAWALTHFGVHRLQLRPSLLKLWVEIISVVLVAGGVFGELAIGVVITSINGTLRSQESTLRDDSSQLVVLIDHEAADANERASNADLKRIELEANVAWRHLTDKQKREIGEKLHLLTLRACLRSMGVLWLGYPRSHMRSRLGTVVVGDGAKKTVSERY
jgi:hypothetical protein